MIKKTCHRNFTEVTTPCENVTFQIANRDVYIDEPVFARADLNDDNDFSDTDEEFFYLHNTQYSVYVILDTSGNIIEVYKNYQPYGAVSVYTGDGGDSDWWDGDETTGSLSSNYYLFTGRRYDPEADLMFYRNRMYSTSRGRFLQRDPIGYKDGLNLYRAYFVPLWTDHDGLSIDTPSATLTQAIIQGNVEAARTLILALVRTGVITAAAGAVYLAQAEFNHAVEQLKERYLSQARSTDPCEQAKQALRQAQRAIRNLSRRVCQHQQYIEYPQSYPGEIRDLTDAIREWRRQIREFNNQVRQNEKVVEILEKLIDKLCSCWYDPTTWF